MHAKWKGEKSDTAGIKKWREQHNVTPPRAIDSVYHSAAFGWDEAVQECKAEGKRLCTASEYCSGGTPRGGVIKRDDRINESGDEWCAVADKRGEYIQVGGDD